MIVVYNQPYLMCRATRGIISRHTVAVVILYNAFLLKITVVYKVEILKVEILRLRAMALRLRMTFYYTMFRTL